MIAVSVVGRRGAASMAVCVLVAACMLTAGAVSASAAAPWWGVTSGARPSVIQPGAARNEEQEIKVSATAGSVVVVEPKSLVEKVQEVGPLKFTHFAYDATHEEAQAALESIYGVGNVEVSGGPGDATGARPYLVTFTGSLSYQPLHPMNTTLSSAFGLNGEAQVTEVVRGQPDGQIVVSAEDLGDAKADGSVTPITIRDTLPKGLKAVAAEGVAPLEARPIACQVASVVSCETKSHLRAFQALEVRISVLVQPGAVSGEENFASVSGGGAGSASAASAPVSFGSETRFGVESVGLAFEEEGGSPDTQAGSHPFQLTASVTLNQNARIRPIALSKDISVALPSGLTGSVTSIPQCTEAQFLTQSQEGTGNECPADTVIGVVNALINEPVSLGPASGPVPLFNLTPAAGEPARFGFVFGGVPIALDVSLRTGGDYGVTVTSHNISQIGGTLSARVTIWGNPSDPRHDDQRGWQCINGVATKCSANATSAQPLLTLPSSCEEPLTATATTDSWGAPGLPAQSAEPVSYTIAQRLSGCERLPFGPTLSVFPESQMGGTPTGLAVDVRLPQHENVEGLATADLKRAVVTLPAGVTVNPGAANGLGVCTPQEIGLSNAAAVSCPESSKVGTAEAISPPLKTPLTGSVYVAQQGNNPFGSLLALYLVLESEGVLIKSAGEVRLDPSTGQITTVFDNIPQQPVADVELHLFGGPRATLLTPPGCGSYTTTSQLTPYSSLVPSEPFSVFQVSSEANGVGCGPQPFAPVLTAGTSNNQAGSFSPFTATFSRHDQEQDLSGVTLTTPPGLLGVLKSVVQCPEPQAAQGTCGPGSLIGHTTVASGAGADPVYVTGQVFLTGPYKGAPFGLSVVVPAAVGPFNLGNVVVRAAVHVDPNTAQITIATDPLPTILDGVPLHLQAVNVTVDREGFMFNPTNCEPLSVTGSLTSTSGASANVNGRFQAANCQSLPFHPVFTVSTQAKASKSAGASLDVKYTSTPGQANTAKVAATLPKQLPARLTTIQKACTEAAFAQNPASCPAASQIGTATATTPILANPIVGPVYLVSHGGAAFPNVVAILQGEGVTVDLTGSVDIKHSVTSVAFNAIPDAPISTFEMKLPEGPHSGLAPNLPAKAKGSFCGQALTMPTTITAQNGAVINQTTKIGVTGCAKVKKTKASKHTKRAHGKKAEKKDKQK
jgi:hypothetical protein